MVIDTIGIALPEASSDKLLPMSKPEFERNCAIVKIIIKIFTIE